MSKDFPSIHLALDTRTLSEMVFDNETRAIPEPVALVQNNKFSEQIHVTVEEAEKLVVDWTPDEERRAKLK